MISSSEQKKKRPRAFLFLCKQWRGKNRVDRDGGDAVPYTRFNKNNAAPRKGRRAFSVHVWHRRRRVIFAAWLEREPRG